MKPNKEKIKAILQLKLPTSSKELKLFLEAIQCVAKLLPKLSEKADRIRQLLRKKSEWNRTERKEEDFNQINKMIAEIPCLAHFARDRNNIVTIDASRTGPETTLWSKENDKQSHH